MKARWLPVLVLVALALQQSPAQNPPGNPAAAPVPDRHATFFMGRVRYSNNDGNDCAGVGENLAKLVSQVRRSRSSASTP